MTKILTRTTPALVAAFLLLAGGGAVGCRRDGDAATSAKAAKPQYHCPMHPTYVSDRPGQCPICKMDLVPIDAASASPTAGAAGAAVAGRAMVALSPERRQLLGVRSEAVTRRHLDRTIRTVGRVAMDERRLHHVHTKYEAYVEKLYVNFVGQMVRKGDHLAALYSPELVATQQEYLLAFRAQQRLAQSGIASVAKGGTDLLEAARQRLLFWDVSPEDIATLERTGKVERTVDLHAELPGYVLQKSAVHGMRVTPADILFDIADLSAVWILADVYESDLATVELGMAAEVTLPYQPGRTWRGTVAFVNPTVEPGTRTVKVRIEVANEGYALKPDMFADVVLRRELGDALFVPESAVLRPGDRRIVFLDLGDGTARPARDRDRGARRGRIRRPLRPRRGRQGRHLGELPDRLRVEPEGGALVDGRRHSRPGAARRPRSGDAHRGSHPGRDAEGEDDTCPEGRVRVPDAPRGDLGRAGLLPDLRNGPGADGAPRAQGDGPRAPLRRP